MCLHSCEIFNRLCETSRISFSLSDFHSKEKLRIEWTKENELESLLTKFFYLVYIFSSPKYLIFWLIHGGFFQINPAGIYLFKVKNGNTRKLSEIYSELTIKTLEWRVVNLASILLTMSKFTHRAVFTNVDFEQVNASWVMKKLFRMLKII